MDFVTVYIGCAAVFLSIYFYLLGREDGKQAQLDKFYEKRYDEEYKYV